MARLTALQIKDAAEQYATTLGYPDGQKIDAFSAGARWALEESPVTAGPAIVDPLDLDSMPDEYGRFDNWFASAAPSEPYTEDDLRRAFNAGGFAQRSVQNNMVRNAAG